MSGLTSVTGGFLGQLANNSASIKRQLDAAQVQQSTGYVSNTYSGLGSSTRTSLDLSPAVQQLQTWQSNIDTATGRLAVTQTALTQITSIASDFFARTNALSDAGASQAGTIGAQARSALEQVAQLLNTKIGDVYVFAGDDTANAPVPKTDAATLIAAVQSGGPGPFSPTIGGAVPPQIEVGDGQQVPVGVVADRNTLTSTSGSYAHDILQALASLAGVTPATDNATISSNARGLLGGAISAIANESGALGNVQADLAKRRDSLAAMQTVLSGQLANAQDTDLAATLTRVATLQTQLQASYQVFAGAKNLSLANYI